jgi:hypothetical protein
MQFEQVYEHNVDCIHEPYLCSGEDIKFKITKIDKDYNLGLVALQPFSRKGMIIPGVHGQQGS